MNFDPDQLTDPAMKEWWQQWQSDAKAATAQAINAWHQWLGTQPRPAKFKCPFQQPVWKNMKIWLLKNVFHFKCAYCESPLELDRYHGDAEHFRPKGEVTFKDQEGSESCAQCILPDGTSIDHPGYFWLAYHWRNLVPACSFCNSGKGKGTQFPIKKGYLLMKRLSAPERAVLEQKLKEEIFENPQQLGWYIIGPRALDMDEEPLLLNPLNPDPQRTPKKHLRYGLGGDVVAVGDSPLGENSIRVFDLRRDALMRRRQKAQESVRRLYLGVRLDSKTEAEELARLDERLKPFREGEEDYSSAALDYLREMERLAPTIVAAAVGD